MRQAAHTTSTPPARHRRGAATGPDAELIRAQAEMDRIAATPSETDRQGARASRRLCSITEFAAETPAATEAGLLAKAMILRRELAVFGEPDESPAFALALSIADDLIRLRTAN